MSGAESGQGGQTDHGVTGTLNGEDMAYRARALAQALSLIHISEPTRPY